MILIVNKRDETPKVLQTPILQEDSNKVSAAPISPRPIRQRERSGVETDDDELLAQVQQILHGQTTSIAEDDLLKEKIIEARLIAQRKTKRNRKKTIFFLFVVKKYKRILFFSFSENDLSFVSE